jgi:hypothetical protein
VFAPVPRGGRAGRCPPGPRMRVRGAPESGTSSWRRGWRVAPVPGSRARHPGSERHVAEEERRRWCACAGLPRPLPSAFCPAVGVGLGRGGAGEGVCVCVWRGGAAEEGSRVSRERAHVDPRKSARSTRGEGRKVRVRESERARVASAWGGQLNSRPELIGAAPGSRTIGPAERAPSVLGVLGWWGSALGGGGTEGGTMTPRRNAKVGPTAAASATTATSTGCGGRGS